MDTVQQTKYHCFLVGSTKKIFLLDNLYKKNQYFKQFSYQMEKKYDFRYVHSKATCKRKYMFFIPYQEGNRITKSLVNDVVPQYSYFDLKQLYILEGTVDVDFYE